ncbi:MAG: hypothetical protein ABIN36_19130 [Ferruginibacter sp.]
MKHPKFRKELLLAIVLSALYFFLSIFYYHLERFGPGFSYEIIKKIVYISLFVVFGYQVYKINVRRKKSKGKVKLRWIFYTPALIVLSAILYYFSPIKLDSENLESKTILKGCYEGNSGRARIRLRKNKNFEISWTPDKSESSDWFYGVYGQHLDTFFLTYEERTPGKVGGRIINTGRNLVSVDTSQSKDKDYIVFLIGDCNK